MRDCWWTYYFITKYLLIYIYKFEIKIVYYKIKYSNKYLKIKKKKLQNMFNNIIFNDLFLTKFMICIFNFVHNLTYYIVMVNFTSLLQIIKYVTSANWIVKNINWVLFLYCYPSTLVQDKKTYNYHHSIFFHAH